MSASSFASGLSFLTAIVFWKAFFSSASSFFWTQKRTRFMSSVSNAFLAALITGPSIPSQWAKRVLGPKRAMVQRIAKTANAVKMFFFMLSPPSFFVKNLFHNKHNPSNLLGVPQFAGKESEGQIISFRLGEEL